MDKARKFALRELSLLVPNVLKRGEGALEKFNAKTDKLGLAPKIQAKDEFSKYKEIYPYLLKKSEGVDFRDKSSIERMQNAMGEDSEHELRFDPNCDYCDCILQIATTCEGRLGLAAAAYMQCWQGRSPLDAQDMVNLVNVLGTCDMETLDVRLWGIFDPPREGQDDGAIILLESMKAFFGGGRLFDYGCPRRTETEFANLAFRLYFYHLDNEEQEELAPYAGDMLYRLASNTYRGHRLSWDEIGSIYFCLSDYMAEGSMPNQARKHFSAAAMFLPDVLLHLEDGSAPHDFLSLSDMVTAIGDPVLLAWHENISAREIMNQRLEQLESQLQNAMRDMQGAVSSLTEQNVHLEEIHKGYARKYAEAVSSGNFGVLEYKGTNIVYALVNREDIDETGINSNGFILVARDAAVDEEGKEDQDLQMIVAVHEYVESVYCKNGVPLNKAHELAVEAEKQFASAHNLQEKYEKFRAKANMDEQGD